MQKLEQDQKNKMEGKGEGKRGNAVSFSPLPLPCHSFSLLSSQLSRQTCAEPLAMQAINFVAGWGALDTLTSSKRYRK